MNRLIRSYGFHLFWILVLIDLVAILLSAPLLHMMTKPLLMPVLTLNILSHIPRKQDSILIIVALIFSFLGDVFLMLDQSTPLFFIMGLVAFLLTHIFYIIYFLKISSGKRSFLSKHPIVILLVACYGGGLLYVLAPFVGDLLLPVIIYAITICTMFLCSIHVYYKVNRRSGNLFIAGAMLFVISDTLLAINKFYAAFAVAPFLIMLTYCSAQYLIVSGYLKHRL